MKKKCKTIEDIHLPSTSQNRNCSPRPEIKPPCKTINQSVSVVITNLTQNSTKLDRCWISLLNQCHPMWIFLSFLFFGILITTFKYFFGKNNNYLTQTNKLMYIRLIKIRFLRWNR